MNWPIGAVSYIHTTRTRGCDGSPNLLIVNQWKNYAYVDPAGTSHSFPSIIWTEVDECDLTSTSYGTRTGYATDGSGDYIDITAPDDPMVRRANGFTVRSNSLTDTNGNYITSSTVGSNETDWTDTLGQIALKVITGPSSIQYQYLNPSGTYSTVTLNLQNFTVQTNFGCAGVVDYNLSGTLPQVSLPVSLVFPGGIRYSFAYEPTSPGSPNVTGRIASVELPTGGTISYQYTGGNNGILYADGSAAGLNRSTSDGTWTYTRSGTSPAWTTTITDPVTPQGNQTVLNFQGIYETQRQVFQGSSSGGTLLQTVVTCYNGNLTNCTTTAVNLPITRRTVFVQLPGGLQSEQDTFYDPHSPTLEVDDYDYGSGPRRVLLRRTLTTYALLGNGIISRPASITVQDTLGNVVAQTTYNYDEGTVTATTGTPQHVGITGSRGNVTSISSFVKSGSTLSRSFTYYDTGTPKTATDVNQAQTTYNSATTPRWTC